MSTPSQNLGTGVSLIDVMSPPLYPGESQNNHYINQYKYTQYLMRRIQHNIKKPPTTSLINNLRYDPTAESASPVQFLVDVLCEFGEATTIPYITLKNPMDNLQTMITFEAFINKSHFIEPLQIDVPDFFDLNTPEDLQCLHYYNHNDKTLYLFNLPEINLALKSIPKQDISQHLLKVPLPMKLSKSTMMKTVASPNGTIYFIGATDKEPIETISFEYKFPQNLPKDGQKDVIEERKDPIEDASSFSVALSYKKRLNPNLNVEIDVLGHGVFTLKAKASSLKYGHSLVYAENGCIYAIGGLESPTAETYTTRCERYIIKEDKWERIKDCIYGVSNPGICSFDEKFLYKFGGFSEQFGETSNKVERYNIEQDEWIEMPFILNNNIVSLHAKCLPIQINTGHFIIIGGQTNTFLYSHDCYVIRATKKTVLEIVKDKIVFNNEECKEGDKEGGQKDNKPESNALMLPLDGRIISHSAVYDGKLFCLGVKPGIKDNICNIFLFNEESWSLVI